MVAQEGGSLFFGNMVILICLCCSGWSHTVFIRVALTGWWVITTNGHELRGDEGVEGSLKEVEWEINDYYSNVLYTHIKSPKKSIKSLHNKNKD